MTAPVRGTQTLVDQMSWVFRRPSVTAIEIAWRWLFGLPFLLVCWIHLQRVLVALPPETAGLTTIDAQNPWLAATQISNAWVRYEPYVSNQLRWLAPIAALVWIAVSSVGRSLVLKRLEPRVALRPLAMLLLQAAWLALFAAVLWSWFRCVAWAAATHIGAYGEPDLIGYSMWLIFLSLGFFTLWAVVSWAISVAPLLMLLEDRSAISALGQSLRLGKTFTGKLVEISMVTGIVNLALMVLAMVLSAAPLPFSDQLGGDALHAVWACAAVFYLVANDYFQVVRLKSFLEFWRTYRGTAMAANLASR
jgi:hypothetical protein